MAELDHLEDVYLKTRSDTDLWQASQLAHESGVVKLEATIPAKPPTDMNAGNTRSEEELKAMGASYDQIGTRKTKTVELPEVQAIRQHYKEVVGKIATGEAALEAVGKAGRKVAEAVAPGVEVAGRAMGLDEEGAAAMAQGFVEFLGGLPGQSESDLTAGVETALAVIPMVGMAMKGSKALGKTIGPSVAKEFDKAVATLKSERGSVPLGGAPNLEGARRAVAAGIKDYGRPWARPTSDIDSPIGDIGFGVTTQATWRQLHDAGIVSLRELTTGEKRQQKLVVNKTIYIAEAPKQGQTPIAAPQAGTASLANEAPRAKGKEKLPGGGVETPVTWDEAVKIDEYQRAFDERLKTFSERLSTQRRGVRSDVQVTSESRSPDAIQTEAFLNLAPGTILKDSDVVAAKRMFKDLAEPTRKLAQWVAANPHDEQAFLALLQRLPQVNEGVNKIAGVYAESGRTQRLLSKDRPTGGMIPAESKERVRLSDPYINQWLEFFKQQDELAKMGAPALTRDKLIETLAGMTTPEEFIAAAKVLSKPSKWDMFIEYWINGLLSGPATHATNIISNAATIAWGIPERQLAAMYSTEVRPSEAVAMLGGILEAQGDAWRLAWQAFKAEESQIGTGKLEGPARAITADALELTGVPGRAVDFLGSIIRLPGRSLLAADDYFKSIAMRAELRALAKRESFRAVTESNLTGQAARNKMREIEERILANPPEDIEQAAKEYAAYVTFTRDLGETGQKVQALANTPVGRLVLPFVRTPTNIFKFAGERTPLAFASQAVREEIAAGGSRRALALAKISLGAMTMGYIGMLAAQGIVTGGGPKDKQLRQELTMTGWQPYSFKIGNTYYSYARIEPLGSLFGMAADAADLIGQLPQQEAEKLGAALVVAISRNLANKTFIKGLSGTLNAVASQDIGIVKSFLEKELPTILPYSTGMSQLTRELDPVMREVNSILDAFKKRVPGYSDTLPPTRNLWGEPILLQGGLGPDMISPIYTSTMKLDPVAKELVRLELPVGMPGKMIEGVPLDPWEYDALVVLQGAKPIIGEMTLRERLAETMQSELYKQSSDGKDGGKKVLIMQVVSAYRDMAQHILTDPELTRHWLGTSFPELVDHIQGSREKQAQKFNAPALTH